MNPFLILNKHYFISAFVLLLLLSCPVRATDLGNPFDNIGVNVHFTEPRSGELEMISQAGFHLVRMDFSWASTEKTEGNYDFSKYDLFLADLDTFHIHALLILDYANPLYDKGLATCSDAGRMAFTKWAVAAVSHFKKRGVIWEIWNEPNGDWFWKPKANSENYAKLALAVSKALRTTAPDETIVGPALSGSDTNFLEATGKAGVFCYWNGVTIHPYTHEAPETFLAAYEKIRELIKHYPDAKPGLDVMAGELGYATTWVDEKTQGEYLAREFLLDVMAHVPLTVWYDWRDDGIDPKDQEANFGIVHNMYHSQSEQVYEPKPAYNAAATFFHQLHNAHFTERLSLEQSTDYALSFTNTKSKVFVAWTTTKTPHEVSIPAPDGIYTITSFDGKKQITGQASHGKLIVLLDGGPCYASLR